MKTRLLSFKTKLPVSSAEAFSWHENTGAFSRLLPPWEKVEILEYSASIKSGSQANLRCKILGPLGFNWLLEHRDYLSGKKFCDIQLSGPFTSYTHSHLFSDISDGSELEDRIEYKLPFSFLSHLFAPLLVEKRLKRTFRYRHRITCQDLSFHSLYKNRPRLSFLISGATGMIGKQLCAFLTTAGHKVSRIVRSPWQAGQGDIALSAEGDIDIPSDCNFDCVVNLAGAGIADQRWSEARKKVLIESRVEFTKKLVSALKKLNKTPETMISTSGLGFYGDVQDNCPDESASAGQGFLAELSQQWEEAASGIVETGCRLVNLRLGVILSASGGALQKMLLPFSLGLGGRLGSGRQQLGWVTLDDVLRAVLFIAYEKSLSGAVNVVSPVKTSNLEFTQALGRALNRPAIFPVPDWFLQLIFGEMAKETLLASSNARPEKLTNAGFSFLYAEPESAIKAALN